MVGPPITTTSGVDVLNTMEQGEMDCISAVLSCGSARHKAWSRGAALKTFTQALCRPISPPKVKFQSQQPIYINDKLGFIFLIVEMEYAAEELKYELIIKFRLPRPYIDVLRRIIINTWGFSDVPMIIFMGNYHALLHLTNEKD